MPYTRPGVKTSGFVCVSAPGPVNIGPKTKPEVLSCLDRGRLERQTHAELTPQ